MRVFGIILQVFCLSILGISVLSLFSHAGTFLVGFVFVLGPVLWVGVVIGTLLGFPITDDKFSRPNGIVFFLTGVFLAYAALRMRGLSMMPSVFSYSMYAVGAFAFALFSFLPRIRGKVIGASDILASKFSHLLIFVILSIIAIIQTVYTAVLLIHFLLPVHLFTLTASSFLLGCANSLLISVAGVVTYIRRGWILPRIAAAAVGLGMPFSLILFVFWPHEDSGLIVGSFVWDGPHIITNLIYIRSAIAIAAALRREDPLRRF